MKMKWVFADIKIDDIYKLDEIYSFLLVLSTEKCKNMSNIVSKLIKLSNDNDLNAVLEKNILGFELAKRLIEFGEEKKYMTIVFCLQ